MVPDKPKNVKDRGIHQKRGERCTTDPPLELLEKAWLCQHLDFSLVASRTVAEHISVLFKPRGLWQFVAATLGN